MFKIRHSSTFRRVQHIMIVIISVHHPSFRNAFSVKLHYIRFPEPVHYAFRQTVHPVIILQIKVLKLILRHARSYKGAHFSHFPVMAFHLLKRIFPCRRADRNTAVLSPCVVPLHALMKECKVPCGADDLRLSFHIAFSSCKPALQHISGPIPGCDEQPAVLREDWRVNPHFFLKLQTAQHDIDQRSPPL